MFKDTLCRKCFSEEETFEHASNCGFENDIYIDTSNMGNTPLVGETAYRLAQVTLRLETFFDIETTTVGAGKRKNADNV